MYFFWSFDLFLYLGLFFLVSVCLLCSKGQSLRCSPGQGNPCRCIVMLYVGEGSEREHWHLLCSLPDFSHFPCYPQATWALLVLLPSEWVCVRSRTLWAFPTNSPVRPGVSPAASSTPTGVFSQRFEALFPFTRMLYCVVCLIPQLFLLVYLHMNVGPPGPPAATLPHVLSALVAHVRPSYRSG